MKAAAVLDDGCSQLLLRQQIVEDDPKTKGKTNGSGVGSEQEASGMDLGETGSNPERRVEGREGRWQQVGREDWGIGGCWSRRKGKQGSVRVVDGLGKGFGGRKTQKCQEKTNSQRNTKSQIAEIEMGKKIKW